MNGRRRPAPRGRPARVDGRPRRPDAAAAPARPRAAGAVGARALRGARAPAVHRLPPPQDPRPTAAGSPRGARGPRASTACSEALDPGARRLWLLARAETRGLAGGARRTRRGSQAVKARRDEAQRFFAGAAGAWDGCAPRCTARAFGLEALLALLPPEWTVADLGCGTGALAAELAPRVRRVVGVDQSAAMLRAARRRLAALRNVELHEARLEALPARRRRAATRRSLVARARLPGRPRAPRSARRRACSAPAARLVVVDAARHDDEALRRRIGQVRPGFEPGRARGPAPGGGPRDAAARALAARARREGPRPRGRRRGRRAREELTAPERGPGEKTMAVSTAKKTKKPALQAPCPSAPARAPGEGPRARRVGAQGDRARREGDARPHGGAARVRARSGRSPASASPARST